MLRRELLSSGATSAALLFIAGCQNGSSALTPAQVVADANGVVANLSSVVTNLLAAKLISAPLETSLFNAMETAQKVLTGLSTSLSATSGASILQQVIGDIESVLTTLGGLGVIPQPYGAIIGAAPVVLSVIEAFVKQYIPSAAAPKAGVTPQQLAQARATLGIAVLS